MPDYLSIYGPRVGFEANCARSSRETFTKTAARGRLSDRSLGGMGPWGFLGTALARLTNNRNGRRLGATRDRCAEKVAVSDREHVFAGVGGKEPMQPIDPGMP